MACREMPHQKTRRIWETKTTCHLPPSPHSSLNFHSTFNASQTQNSDSRSNCFKYLRFLWHIESKRHIKLLLQWLISRSTISEKIHGTDLKTDAYLFLSDILISLLRKINFFLLAGFSHLDFLMFLSGWMKKKVVDNEKFNLVSVKINHLTKKLFLVNCWVNFVEICREILRNY